MMTRLTYTNINTNKLHDELIAVGIMPLLVESLDGTTWITYADGTDMGAVDAVVLAHDPTPTVVIKTPIADERLDVLEPTVESIIVVLEASV